MDNRPDIFFKAIVRLYQFKQWLVAVSDKAKAKCKSCNKVFNLSNMGKQALVSHAAGKKHMAVTTKIQMFLNPKLLKKIRKTVKSLVQIRMIALVLLRKIHLRKFHQLYT